MSWNQVLISNILIFIFRSYLIISVLDVLSASFEREYWNSVVGKLTIGAFFNEFIDGVAFLESYEKDSGDAPSFYKEILVEFSWRCGVYMILSLKSEYLSLRALESRYFDFLVSKVPGNCMLTFENVVIKAIESRATESFADTSLAKRFAGLFKLLSRVASDLSVPWMTEFDTLSLLSNLGSLKRTEEDMSSCLKGIWSFLTESANSHENSNKLYSEALKRLEAAFGFQKSDFRSTFYHTMKVKESMIDEGKWARERLWLTHHAINHVRAPETSQKLPTGRLSIYRLLEICAFSFGNAESNLFDFNLEDIRLSYAATALSTLLEKDSSLKSDLRTQIIWLGSLCPFSNSVDIFNLDRLLLSSESALNIHYNSLSEPQTWFLVGFLWHVDSIVEISVGDETREVICIADYKVVRHALEFRSWTWTSKRNALSRYRHGPLTLLVMTALASLPYDESKEKSTTLHYVTDLNLYRSDATPFDWLDLPELLNKLQFLTCLNLSYCSLNSTHADLLAGILRRPHQLAQMDLTGNEDSLMTANLISALLMSPTFVKLDLDRMQLETVKSLYHFWKVSLSKTDSEPLHSRVQELKLQLKGNKRINDIDFISAVVHIFSELESLTFKVGQEGIRHLSAKLPSLHKLKKLDLSGSNISLNGLEAFSNALLGSPHVVLEHLDFSDCPIEDKGVSILRDGFSSVKTLKELKLYNCKIGDSGAVAVVAAVPRIEGLWLGENNIVNEGIAEIATLVAQSTTMTHLDLSGNEICPRKLEELAKAISMSSSRMSIILEFKGLRNQKLVDVTNFVTSIPSDTCTLQSLNISGQLIADFISTLRHLVRCQWHEIHANFFCKPVDEESACKSVYQLSNVFQFSSTIQVLSLNNVHLGDELVESLIESIIVNKSQRLATLHLDGNKLSHCSGNSLARLVTTSNTLSDLSLGGNYLRSEGAIAIADALVAPHSCPLEVLNLRVNEIGANAVPHFANMISKLASLRSFNMGFTIIDNYSARILAKALQISPKLETFELNINGLDDAAVECLKDACKISPMLQDIAFHD